MALFLFFSLSWGVCRGPRSAKVVGWGPLVQEEGHSHGKAVQVGKGTRREPCICPFHYKQLYI